HRLPQRRYTGGRYRARTADDHAAGQLPHPLSRPRRGLSGAGSGSCRMSEIPRVIVASALLEFRHFARSRLFLLCTLLAAVNFLVGVSLFGLTGSRAPTAIVNNDPGSYAADFIQALNGAHHSFGLRPMRAAEAEAALRAGRIVAIITIPADFTRSVM